MNYCFSKTLQLPFNVVVNKVLSQLKIEGFGVLTTINIRDTLNSKLGVDYPRYVILGACNPTLAFEALQAESKVGTMLPCNVIVRDVGEDGTEVAAVDPVSSMLAIDNPKLLTVATTIQAKLANVIKSL